jgi:hypothetical protein
VIIYALLLVAFQATANPVEQKLTCIEALDNRARPNAQLLLMWSRLRVLRIESLDVYSDGSVLMQIQLRRDRGLKTCRAKVTKERMESFKAELARSRVCSVPAPKRNSGEENDGIHLDLGPKQRCDLELSPRAWTRKPATRSVQLAIDRLRSEICEGACADPKPPSQRFQLVEDASRVSPEFRHLYRNPTELARPDAAPPKKP